MITLIKPKALEEKTAGKKEVKGNKAKKLPPDVYGDEIEPLEIELESGKIMIRVKRGGEYGLPRLDIRYYAKNQRYEGYTRSGINIPIDCLPELVADLYIVLNECEDFIRDTLE